MGLLEDYRVILGGVISVIETGAMEAIGEELKNEINETAEDMYFADADQSRPKLFGDGDYTIFHDALSVTVWNRTRMQGTDYGTPEVDFVEGGYPEYNMPGPRPFMEKARDQYVESGRPDQVIQGVLVAAGLA